jgi:hypothetical protein
MTVQINETPGENYTWATAGFAWSMAEAGKNWASAHTTVFDAVVSETMPFGETSGWQVALYAASYFGLGDSRNGAVQADRHEVIALAETYLDYINFILSVTESLGLGEVLAKNTQRPETESFNVGEGRISLPSKGVIEPLALAEVVEPIAVFWCSVAEAIMLGEAEAKASARFSVETFTLADALLRHANAVLADLAVRSTTMDETAFRALLADKGPLGYERFRDLVPGDYEYSKAIIGLLLSAPVTGDRTAIEDAIINVDVPDVRDRGTATVPVAGVTIIFNRSFAEPPEVQVTLKAGGPPSLPEIISITIAGFSVRLVDAADGATPVAGTVSWSALGY